MGLWELVCCRFVAETVVYRLLNHDVTEKQFIERPWICNHGQHKHQMVLVFVGHRDYKLAPVYDRLRPTVHARRSRLGFPTRKPQIPAIRKNPNILAAGKPM
jgi:hypothetical protein